MVRLTGALFNDGGTARVGITAYAFAASLNADENTATGSAAGSDATDASGEWDITGLAENLYDVRIDDGTSKRWRRANERVQLEMMEVSNLLMRNPADTFVYDLVPAAITANRTLNLPLITATRTLIANDTPLADNEQVLLGTGSDANLFYDGTDLIIRPSLVGTGAMVIDQQGTDVKILALRSSDVATGLTTIPNVDVATNDFAVFGKRDPATGGLIMQAMSTDGVETAVLILSALGGTAETTKTTAGRGLITMEAREHDGANALADVTADGNVFAIVARVGGTDVARFIVDEDGDLFVVSVIDVANAGPANVIRGTAFDSYDDVALVRAFEHARQPAGLIRSQWDSHVKYNEQHLIDAGLLGAPVAEGGMWNLTQHTRLLNGAVWQLGTRAYAQEQRIAQLERQLLALGGA